MNPNGFWEHPRFTVGGFKNDHTTREDFKDALSKEFPFCKVVPSALKVTDYNYVGGVVFMIRHPYNVATSQENLKRDGRIVTEDGHELNAYEGVTVNDPKMFIQQSYDAAKFFIDSGITPLMVDYEDVLEDPDTEFMRIEEYLGVDMSNAAKTVTKKLNRSKPKPSEHDYSHELWEQAVDIYDLLSIGDFKAIVDLVERDIARKEMPIPCFRLRMDVQPNFTCKSCMSNAEGFRDSVKKRAEEKGIDWKNEPCAYECYYAEDSMTVEDSIANNFWLKEETVES